MRFFRRRDRRAPKDRASVPSRAPDHRLEDTATTVIPPEEPPDVAGLSGKEAVFRILAYTKKPMRRRDIAEWLGEFGQEPLGGDQVAGGFYDLFNKYDKVVERVEPGVYRIHQAWNGKPLVEQSQRGRPASPRARRGRDAQIVGVVIPCYGVCWDRSLVWWRNGALLGKLEGDKADVVDFADQTGVYVLYQWPRVNYVGRTTANNLYQRLSEHANTREDRRGRWDKFSWFGLRTVGDGGRLHDPEAGTSVQHNVTMMEALLISSLEPPFNNKSGDGMGAKYLQIPSPEIEEREEQKIAKAVERVFQRARQG